MSTAAFRKMYETNHGVLDLESVLNFRDVETFIRTDSPLLKSGLLFRSARPDAASSADRNFLTSTLKIKTIIDLRTPTEHLEARKAFAASLATPTAPGLAPRDPQQPRRIEGIEYVDVNLNGDAYTNALLRHLNWTQTAQLYGLYALGYRKDAIVILAKNVMAPRGLSGLAIDTLTYSKPLIEQIFHLLAEAETYPVLVHCTQGKDRTGLIILLILLLCGIGEELVENDYLASQEGLAPEREAKVEEVKSIGLPEQFADCELGWVGKVKGWLQEQYGGVEEYLGNAGIGEDVRERVRKALLA